MHKKAKRKTSAPIHPEDNLWVGWFRSQWRPAMAWAYMIICLFDFIFAPAMTSFAIVAYKAQLPIWQSLTLSNGGIMHLAFGAILGVAAWGRTQETVIGGRGGYGPYSPYGPGGGEYIIERETNMVVPLRSPKNIQKPIVPKPKSVDAPPTNQPVID